MWRSGVQMHPGIMSEPTGSERITCLDTWAVGLIVPWVDCPWGRDLVDTPVSSRSAMAERDFHEEQPGSPR
jgi:hypothetical protein